MKRSLLILHTFLIPLQVTAKDGLVVLHELSRSLAEVRALPVDAKTHYSCPAGLDMVVGMTQEAVDGILPKPDFGISKSERSYFLASPRPPQSRGGGFPEVTFHYKSNVVVEVTCYRAR